jgi:hypothetical protein
MFEETTMDTTTSSIDWINAGTTSSVDALVLRFSVVLNGLYEHVGSAGGSWFLVDVAGRIVDCGADGAAPLLGAPVTRLAGGLAAAEIESAWHQVLNGRTQTVWPWHGGRAKAAVRSIELHPLRDTLSDARPIIGALVVMVDATSSALRLSTAA